MCAPTRRSTRPDRCCRTASPSSAAFVGCCVVKSHDLVRLPRHRAVLLMGLRARAHRVARREGEEMTAAVAFLKTLLNLADADSQLDRIATACVAALKLITIAIVVLSKASELIAAFLAA